MQTEVENCFRFYVGPEFTKVNSGPLKPWLDYHLREECLKDGEVVLSRPMVFLDGSYAQWLVDRKIDWINEELPQPDKLTSIREIVDWVNEQEIG